MTDYLIDLKNISKIYNEGHESEVRALNDVSLSIEPGEFTALLGQSGSGKSTMMNILGCLDIPTYGEYWLDGENVSEIPPKRLSVIRNLNIGFIFQGFNLIPALSAIENVELPLVYRGMAKSEKRRLSLEALELVGLSDRIHHRPFELSGGQQQRVAIARAIAAQPPIIMADEPTGNLDTRSGGDIMLKLCELNDAGTTVLLITHDMKLAQVAKRIVRIQDGQIISDDRMPEELRKSVLEEVSAR